MDNGERQSRYGAEVVTADVAEPGAGWICSDSSGENGVLGAEEGVTAPST